MEVEYKDGVWLNHKDVSPGLVLTRQEILDRVRSEGTTVANDAKIAVFLGEDEIIYAVETHDDWVFFHNGLFTPDDRNEMCKAVNKVFTEVDDERDQD